VLERRGRDLEGERDAAAARIGALTEQLAALTAQHDTLVAEHDARREELTELRAKVEAAETLVTSRAETRDGEMRSLSDAVEVLKAEKASLAGALSAAREERARLHRELVALKATPPPEEILAQNADLLRRIDEVTDAIMAAGKKKPKARAAPRS
jgi:chromosome segregation ATPase